MKTKKLLSLLLCFVMLCSMFTPVAFASDTEITVYVTLSKYGEILSLESGQYLACVPVVMEEENPDLDTVFRQFHALYHPNGEAAYSSYEGEYGTAIDMLWEDTSDLFGYQVNGGTESVYGLSHAVQNGDYVDVCIYQSEYPDTENYTRFDKCILNKENGEEITLNLSVAGYDENWNTVFSPCANAEITINGEKSRYFTNENGDVAMTFCEEGTYILSATQEKTVDNSVVTAICAPVCVAKISNPQERQILDNLAEKYSSDEAMPDGNAYWFAANIADYGKIYPETPYCLSEGAKQSIADSLIDMCTKSQKPGDLAKGIIALRSMGYDAKNTYTAKGEHLDIPQKLLELVETDFDAVTNVYTLPYAIIALGAGEGYAPREITDLLINYAAENSKDWLNTEFGTDALTPMLLALSPYADSNDTVKSAVDNAAEILISLVNEDGMVGNAPSTALAIVGLCAIGTDPKTVENNGINLIDGLLSQVNDSKDGFAPTENSFATEQGMRALNAYMLFKNGERIFNFVNFPMEEVRHTPVATVKFDIDPKSSEVTVDGSEAEDNIFYLEAGTYSYKASKSGYKSKEDDFIISETDTENYETITIEVSLTKKSSGGGGGGGFIKPSEPVEKKEDTITVPDVLYAEKTFPDISENPHKPAIESLAARGIINGTDAGFYLPDYTITRAEFTTIIAKALSLNTESKEIFTDVQKTDWFFPFINAAYNKGIVSGVSATEFNPYGTITREEAAAMIARTAEICGINTNVSDAEEKIILCRFADYTSISSWATKSMAFCYETGILNISELSVTPQKTISRAEMAQMIYNMLKEAKFI